MGRDKSGLAYHGVPEWRRVQALLGACCARVLVSVSEEQREAFAGEDLVVDRWAQIGPMGGVASALSECASSAVLTVACDMPGLDAATVNTLIAARDVDVDATVVMNARGQLEPLCAVYEPGMLPQLERAIEAGEYSLNRVLSEARVCRVEVPDAEALTNVNTPEEASRMGADGVESMDGSD